MGNDGTLSALGDRLSNAIDSPEAKKVESWSRSVSRKILNSPPLLITTTLGIATTSYLLHWRYFKRIRTTAYLTPSILRWRKVLVGRCTSVGDADGFRLYHTPGPLPYRLLAYPEANKKPNGSSNHHLETLSIRLAGADAPESSHFGKPEQPFAKEAKEELEKLVLGKTVWCEVAHVDQYQRLVSFGSTFRCAT
jgi:hypothetical protein